MTGDGRPTVIFSLGRPSTVADLKQKLPSPLRDEGVLSIDLRGTTLIVSH